MGFKDFKDILLERREKRLQPKDESIPCEQRKRGGEMADLLRAQKSG